MFYRTRGASSISQTIFRYTRAGLLELCVIYDNKISYISGISNKVASAWIIFEDKHTSLGGYGKKSSRKKKRHERHIKGCDLYPFDFLSTI